MHGSQAMTAELIADITAGLVSIGPQTSKFDVLVCPPSPYLAAGQKACSESLVKLGAQNVSAFESGAYTGEIAIPMLAEFHCEYVLVGHSERRELYGETDADIANKFAASIASDSSIVPVLCVGETLEQRQSGTTEIVIAEQLDAILATSGIEGFSKAVIAYEPVWAIGTGETASPEQAQQIHSFIRNKLAKLDLKIANSLQILYGGSMKPVNATELLTQPDIDGGLIGGAALDAESFLAICVAANELTTDSK